MSGYMFHLCILSYTLFVFIVYIMLYEFQRGCAGEQGNFQERKVWRAHIVYIKLYTLIMTVYIMLYIYGLYGARKGVCTRLCILRHTHLHAVGLSCV